ncbi:MAG TPA: hypothetical protein DCL77_14445 [Prolixibacteraceae bacterium]|jgi:hypothetical protein|nr:hypothetical protein [Prolixibacteraceae bacterium]
MTERPILMSEVMVMSLLDDIKRETRRVIKTTKNGWDCQKMEFTQARNIIAADITEKYKGNSKSLIGFHAFFKAEDSTHQLGIRCPYGQVGDVLWVRESWRRQIITGLLGSQFIFKAKKGNHGQELSYEESKLKWKPSIHMPKNEARIWLQLEEVKVERLKDITDEGAIAEGVRLHKGGIHWLNYIAQKYHTTQFIYHFRSARSSYMSLWQMLAKEKSVMPRNDPWVWVLKFKVLSTTGRPEILNP